MATVTVQHEGKDIQVELPAGYLSPDEVKAGYVSRETLKTTHVLKEDFDRRFQEWVPREKAAEDEKIVQSVLSKHKPKADVDVEAAKAEWRKAELEPVTGELGTLREQLRNSAIREAAKQYFKEDFLNNPFASVESKFADKFAFDAKLGYVVAKEGDGFVAAMEPKPGRPYADPAEYFARLAKQPEYKTYLREEPKIQGNSGYSQNGKAAGAKTLSLAEFDALSPQAKVEHFNGGGNVTD